MALTQKFGPYRLTHGLHQQDEAVLDAAGRPVTFEVKKVNVVEGVVETADGRTFPISAEAVGVKLDGKVLAVYVGETKTSVNDLRKGDFVTLAEEKTYGSGEIGPKQRKPGVEYGTAFMAPVELDRHFNGNGSPAFVKYTRAPNPGGQLAEAKRRVQELEALVEKKPATAKK